MRILFLVTSLSLGVFLAVFWLSFSFSRNLSIINLSDLLLKYSILVGIITSTTILILKRFDVEYFNKLRLIIIWLVLILSVFFGFAWMSLPDLGNGINNIWS